MTTGEQTGAMSKSKPPEQIVYCGVEWTGWEWRAQVKVDSKNNKVRRSDECFASQAEAAREFVRMVQLYRGDTLKVDSQGGRRKPRYRLLSPGELTSLIEQSRKNRANACGKDN